MKPKRLMTIYHFIHRSLMARLFLIALFVIAISLTVGGYILSYQFRQYATAQLDEQISTVMDSLSGLAQEDENGTLYLREPLGQFRFNQPYSGWYWQINESGQNPFRSRSLWDFALTPDLQENVSIQRYVETQGPGEQILRLLEHDITMPESGKKYRFQVGADISQLQNDIAGFNGLFITALVIIFIVIFLAMTMQVALVLRPMRLVKRDVQRIRTGESLRMDGTYPYEVAPLADEVNELLGRNEKLVDRARRHAGNLAHAVKTPLSIIRNDAQSMTDPKAGHIARKVDDIRQIIDHHLKRARIAAGRGSGSVNVADRLSKVSSAFKRLYPDIEIDFEQADNKSCLFAGEVEDFDEIIGNLLDNAGKWARHHVHIRLVSDETYRGQPVFLIIVEDDGPGVSDDKIADLFERGVRLDELVPGSGLGLSIVRDIVELYGGDISASRSGSGGLKISVNLPARQ